MTFETDFVFELGLGGKGARHAYPGCTSHGAAYNGRLRCGILSHVRVVTIGTLDMICHCMGQLHDVVKTFGLGNIVAADLVYLSLDVSRGNGAIMATEAIILRRCEMQQSLPAACRVRSVTSAAAVVGDRRVFTVLEIRIARGRGGAVDR